MDAWRRVVKSGELWFSVDNSYFDAVREQQFRITRNAFQVDATKHISDGDRFAALGLTIKSMRNFATPGYALAVEQSDSFMRDIAGDVWWLTERIKLAKTLATEVRLREWNRNKAAAQSTLKADLQGAKYVLTHSSAAAVEALLEGVHIVTSPMCAVASVAPTGRLAAMNVLADHQWPIDEIKQGKAWSWLNREQ